MSIQSIFVASNTTEADLFGAATTTIHFDPKYQTYCITWHREGEDRAVGFMATQDDYEVWRQVQADPVLSAGLMRFLRNRKK